MGVPISLPPDTIARVEMLERLLAEMEAERDGRQHNEALSPAEPRPAAAASPRPVPRGSSPGPH